MKLGDFTLRGIETTCGNHDASRQCVQALAPLQGMASDQKVATTEINLTDPMAGLSAGGDPASLDGDPITWRLSKEESKWSKTKSAKSVTFLESVSGLETSTLNYVLAVRGLLVLS